jgi:ferrous iron transport protein A
MTTTPVVEKKLSELRRGARGVIVKVGNDRTPVERVQQLLDLGILEGAEFEIAHEAPFGGDPIAVHVRGSVLALRRSEASEIRVQVGGDRS